MRYGRYMLTTLALLVTAGATVSDAAVPTVINYQGQLTDTNAAPLDTTVAMVFTIYDSENGGTTKWSETQPSVTVSGGRFSVLLGTVVPIADTVFADASRYLGVRVGSDPELVPRSRIVSVGYAQRVSTVDGAGGGHITSAVQIGPGHVATGTGAFVAGANNKGIGAYATVGGGEFNHAFGQYSTIGGGGGPTIADSNFATGDYATIAGGRRHLASGESCTVGGGDDQTATGNFSVIAGGVDNATLALYSVVSGGAFNLASGRSSTVLGGEVCRALGDYATSVGGSYNAADAKYAFAAGRNVDIDPAHPGAMLFADSMAIPFVSSAANEFAVRASGGVRLVTSIGPFGEPATGVCVAAGSGTWTSCSDSAVKSDVAPVRSSDVLNALRSLRIYSWRYRGEADSIRHIGPMAQDFYAAFGLGADARSIPVVDADGVALAAIQQLAERMNAQLADRDREIADLKIQIEALRKLMSGEVTAR